MKRVVSISLGPVEMDCSFRQRFLGEMVQVERMGTDGDARRAAQLISEQAGTADAIGLGRVAEHYTVGTDHFVRPETRKLEKLAGDTLVSTGARLREIVQEWSLRSAQQELSNFFNNAKVLFLSGTTNYRLASVMGEYTENLSFADPVLQFGAPGLLHSLHALEMYAAGSDPVLRFGPEDGLRPSLRPASRPTVRCSAAMPERSPASARSACRFRPSLPRSSSTERESLAVATAGTIFERRRASESARPG